VDGNKRKGCADSMTKQVVFKYNEDDLLEILTEHLAKENDFGEFCARAVIVGTPGKDLRMIAIIGDSEDDSIRSENLEELDEKMEYNGSHSKAQYINNMSVLLKKIKEKDF